MSKGTTTTSNETKTAAMSTGAAMGTGIEDQKILRLVEAFEQVFDDVEVRHAARVASGMSPDAPVGKVLGAATTVCLPLNQEISTSLCLQCNHFIGSQRLSDGSLVLRCWSHRARPRMARGTKRLKVVTPFD